MTCFWDGILNALKYQYTDKNFKNIFTKKKKANPKNLILFLKKNNCNTDNVLWCNQPLTEKEKEENYKFIASYSIEKINNGHLCSSCDPFILLICELFEIDIEHLYLENEIIYKNINNDNDKKIWYFKSNNDHFQLRNKKFEYNPNL